MNHRLKLEISIKTSTDEEKMRIGSEIHKQLQGNPDYIDSNIILNVDAGCEVWLGIFKECKEIPKITIQ